MCGFPLADDGQSRNLGIWNRGTTPWQVHYMKFVYTMDNKRYHTLNYYNRTRYGGKVFKASLDAGLLCPNRRAEDGRGGCIYCDSGARYFAGPGDIAQQMEQEIRRIHGKWPGAGIIAYFQAGTNTFAPAETLRALWEPVLAYPNVVGLSIATRADCLEAEKLALLEEFRDQTDLTVELGLQTIWDDTAAKIGRGHDYDTFRTGYAALKQRGIRTCVHLINGLPGETEERMLETAKQVGGLKPDGVKLHLLHVTEGTALAELWRRGNYEPMEKEAYVRVIAKQLRYFPPETVIERLTGDGDKTKLLAPDWSRDKISILGAIDREMKDQNFWQGELAE